MQINYVYKLYFDYWQINDLSKHSGISCLTYAVFSAGTDDDNCVKIVRH